MGEYISLQEVTKYCNYSQEYLSLRARQGKLKAVKFGRNWLTKKEWLEEYLEKVEEYNNLKTKKVISPPENLPIEVVSARLPLVKPVPQIQFIYVVALVFVLLIAGIFYGRDSFKVVYHDASPFVQEFSGGFDRGLAQVFKTVSSYTYIVGGAGDIIVDPVRDFVIDATKKISVGISNGVENTIKVIADTISDIPQSLATVSLTTASIGEVFKEYSQWISQRYLAANDFVEEKINQGSKAITEFFGKPEKIAEEKLIPKPGEEGMVVIPSTEKDEEVKEKIKAAFSDEVKVEPKDKTSGIITPIFREREGQKYLYILVPIQN